MALPVVFQVKLKGECLVSEFQDNPLDLGFDNSEEILNRMSFLGNASILRPGFCYSEKAWQCLHLNSFLVWLTHWQAFRGEGPETLSDLAAPSGVSRGYSPTGTFLLAGKVSMFRSVYLGFGFTLVLNVFKNS